MKTINFELPDDVDASQVKVTVDGVEYAPKGTNAKTPERVLWTPKVGETYWIIGTTGAIGKYTWGDSSSGTQWLNAGNIFPTREHAEAAKRHREAQSVIDRYCYAQGIDTRWKEGVVQYTVYCSSDSLCVTSYKDINDGSPLYVESTAIANQIIADCGDQIRTVLLRGNV